MDWFWIGEPLARALHAEQLAAHGGGNGVRDPGLLDSALQRPRNPVGYGEPDAADLAASLAYGIARKHPFVDGNKRTAFVCGAVFMELNGFRMTATEPDVVLTFVALAAGDIPEPYLATWFRANTRPA